MWRINSEYLREKNLKKKIRNKKVFLKRVMVILIFVLSFVLMLGTLSLFWLNRTWPHLSMSELVYTITNSIKGTDSQIINGFIFTVLVPTLFLFVIMIIIPVRYIRTTKVVGVVATVLIICIFSQSISLAYTWKKLDVSGYINAKNSDQSFIDEYYVDPLSVSVEFPEQKRNLVYIFLESMEVTYSEKQSGGAYEVNYIPELTEISLKNDNFSEDENILNGAHSLEGSTWTVGGLFAQSAGLPLNIPIDKNSMDTQESFFSGATLIGDILKRENYNQAFMIGSEASFQGRDLMYKEHGGYEIYDYVKAQEEGWIPEDYRVFWGYEDSKLFENAMMTISELAEEPEPFNFTMLTVDTHFEDGYVCEKCVDKHGERNQYGNVISCSDRQVSDFVKWIQKQDFYENTTIILCGDHPTMDSDFCNEIGSYDRRVYTSIINSAKESVIKTTRQYSTFDMFPTTLSSLGANIEGGRLALGTDLYSDRQTWVEVLGKEEINLGLQANSKILDNLSQIKTDTTKLFIRDGGQNEVEIFVGAYKEETGEVQVTLRNIPTGIVDLDKIEAIILSRDGEQIIKRVEMVRGEDTNYNCTLELSELPELEFALEILMYEQTKGSYQLYYGVLEKGLNDEKEVSDEDVQFMISEME
ncbi:LTA synthase family protein [Ohessyouella blattaphilus]|uniref:LTA synthase family protein n=1 Tax=Ohessyouella blattaphilus TaxID=2949333 RepID=A0ABT1EHH2_9FIRM|nr:LTA synthase family protein [Ohessyouella blattaphilus]MCP1110139.1 LTA synthase family protein [Ohessyouella blattaphilus]MCR8563533.1 LTA synthase family protein [Ohessyouella blattaphilus]